MVTTLQKHAPIISILLLIALLVALLFYPDSSRGLSMGILIFSIGTAIIFVIHRNWQKHKEDELSNTDFLRNTIIDLLGLALIMGSAVWLGRLTGIYVGLAWGKFASIIIAMAVGFIAAFLVGKVWGKVAEPIKVSS